MSCSLLFKKRLLSIHPVEGENVNAQNECDKATQGFLFFIDWLYNAIDTWDFVF